MRPLLRGASSGIEERPSIPPVLLGVIERVLPTDTDSRPLSDYADPFPCLSRVGVSWLIVFTMKSLILAQDER